MKSHLHEKHFIQRGQWLRAAVLGANDGIISTASLIMGFVEAHADARTIILSGIAGLGAGALSMASGEYVSVSSQHDTEQADLKREKKEIARDFQAEERELAGLYQTRGLTTELASQVAKQLMAKDPLAAHAREELGISDESKARPLVAALASALSFSLGAIFPVLVVCLAPTQDLLIVLGCSTVFLLALLGFISAKIGGSSPWPAMIRVCLCGILAMAVTGAIGLLSHQI